MRKPCLATQLNRVQVDGEPLDPRGHNCFPKRGSNYAWDVNPGLWFGASYNGGATGQGMFRRSDFRKFFNSPLNPC